MQDIFAFAKQEGGTGIEDLIILMALEIAILFVAISLGNLGPNNPYQQVINVCLVYGALMNLPTIIYVVAGIVTRGDANSVFRPIGIGLKPAFILVAAIIGLILGFLSSTVGSAWFVSILKPAAGITAASPSIIIQVLFNNFIAVLSPGQSATGSFTVGANSGSYQCTISAQSSGYQTGGNLNMVSTAFNLQVGQACTQPTPPLILQPTQQNPCNTVCPLDPAIAGRDLCAASGLVTNLTACLCQAPVNCALTGTCPVSTKCSDGTNVGTCNANGQRCIFNAQNATILQTDATCAGPAPPPGPNQTACLPLIQKQITTAVGGISLFGFNIGGTPVSSCVIDPFGVGVILAVIGLILAIIGSVTMKGGRLSPLLVIGALLLLAGLASIGFSIIADNALLATVGGIFVVVMVVLAIVAFILVKVGKYV